MPNQPIELLFEYVKHDQERKAREREELRQAVATRGVPLPYEVAEALTYLFPTDLREVLRDHPGHQLAERRTSYLISLDVFERCVSDLLEAIIAFEAASGDRTLFGRLRAKDLNEIERGIQKELFAAANAAHSLVDHSRRLLSVTAFCDYDTQRAACFKDDGLHELVIGLRVLLHHLHIVKPGWNLQTSYIDKSKNDATFTITKLALSRAIDQHKEGFSKANAAAMQSYLQAASDKLNLKIIFEDYRARAALFHRWMRTELESPGLVALHDYDRCLEENKKRGTRTFWKAMLGNWLRNWKTPPDPHNHLARFLTHDQIESVYALPRNSTAQVDLVIAFMDTDNAIDDDLRKMGYELFERSPPPVGPMEKSD